MVEEKHINLLLEEIKKNKKYTSIHNDLVKNEIKGYFKKNQNKIKILEKPKSEKFKKIIKEIRAKLHSVHSSFQSEDKEKREYCLRRIQGINDYENHNKILETSLSSKERLEDYKNIYKEIFKVTGKPKKIIDLGSGLNPISFPYLGINKLTYLAYDIDEDEIDFLNRYFDLMKRYSKISGKASILDIRDVSSLKILPKADICFLFKVFDVLEKNSHKLSEEIIKSLKSEYIIVSFAIKTISGKKMNHPYRGWIESMLDRINIKFEKILTDNEVFYIIKKQALAHI